MHVGYLSVVTIVRMSHSLGPIFKLNVLMVIWNEFLRGRNPRPFLVVLYEYSEIRNNVIICQYRRIDIFQNVSINAVSIITDYEGHVV